jgi:hypothetical protein
MFQIVILVHGHSNVQPSGLDHRGFLIGAIIDLEVEGQQVPE